MKKFFNDLKQYKNYMLYAVKANLKEEVADSYLNWLWWILDPLMFMLVYSFVALIVFGRGEQYFPVFVFIGLNTWNFFSKTLTRSVKLVKAYKGTISKVYIPKYVLILITILQNLFKLAVSFTLVFITMLLYKVPLTWCFLNIIPIFVTVIVFTFGCACLMLHVGVYIADLSNVIQIVLKLVFYMSGIFYSIPSRVPEPFSTVLLSINPMAFFINELRNSLLYGKVVNYMMLCGLFILGCILSVWGVSIINKHENSYVKVI